MTQSMIETHNVQGMIVGYNGQPQPHDPEHLRVVQLQGHKETSVLGLGLLLVRRDAKAQGEFVSVRDWRYRTGLTTQKCVCCRTPQLAAG